MNRKNECRRKVFGGFVIMLLVLFMVFGITGCTGKHFFSKETSDIPDAASAVMSPSLAEKGETEASSASQQETAGQSSSTELMNSDEISAAPSDGTQASPSDEASSTNMDGTQVPPSDENLSTSTDETEEMSEDEISSSVSVGEDWDLEAEDDPEEDDDYEAEDDYKTENNEKDRMPFSGLIISEAMSSNSKYAEINGTHPDWIELLNCADEAVMLSDYYVSDDKEELDQFRLPEHLLDPGEYYIIYCNGIGEGDQAPFKISSKGEKIYLSNDDGLCDKIQIPGDLPKDKSYGRNGSKWRYFDLPTPGRKNAKGYKKVVLAPAADHKSGIYDDPIVVSLSGEGTIYYTLDGSRPTKKSSVYSDKGIQISGVTTLRAFAVNGGGESEYISYTYVIGEEQHSLPILVVNGPYDNVLGSNGVVQRIKKGSGVEAEVMMTLIEDGEEKFTVPCGISLHGNNGGSRDCPKQNFNVHFRSKYGLGRLKYKVFDDLDIESFNMLLLKGGSEDWSRTMIRDEFMTHMVIGNTALCAQACKPVVMYLSGKYWGIYFIREHLDEDYVASHYDVSEESVNLISGYGSVEAGSSARFDKMISFVKNNDLDIDENYDRLLEYLDIDSLMDWYICRSYMGDRDYANIRYFCTKEYDNKWRWMYYDLDWGFDPTAINHKTPVTDLIRNNDNHILIWKIVHSERGKDAFLKRYAYLMNTILNEEYIKEELDMWRGILTPEAERDRVRWNRSLKEWNSYMDFLYTFVSDGKRNKLVLADIKKFFGLSDKKMKKYFGSLYDAGEP
ncbi:MAG: CotH kinase family protein [Lachnospiraceae bacterium]|nr:CotH kinase family protein [Lachnospiraceae bacterium]